MKRVSITIKMLLLVLPILLCAEGWNSIVTTTATVDYIASACFSTEFADMDQFVNSSGLHLVVEDDDGISYKQFNTSGVLQSSSSIATLGYFPNIVGDENNLYVIYYANNSIYIKKSTNNGGSWAEDDYLYLGHGFYTGVDVALNSAGVHIVYGLSNETYYRRNNGTDWLDYKHVSDGTSGSAPQIALSDNRIHVSWNTNPNASNCDGEDRYSRDRAGTTWENEQNVGYSNSYGEDLIVVGDKLHMFFFVSGVMSYPLYHLSRDLDGIP